MAALRLSPPVGYRAGARTCGNDELCCGLRRRPWFERYGRPGGPLPRPRRPGPAEQTEYSSLPTEARPVSCCPASAPAAAAGWRQTNKASASAATGSLLRSMHWRAGRLADALSAPDIRGCPPSSGEREGSPYLRKVLDCDVVVTCISAHRAPNRAILNSQPSW